MLNDETIDHKGYEILLKTLAKWARIEIPNDAEILALDGLPNLRDLQYLRVKWTTGQDYGQFLLSKRVLIENL